MKKALLSSILFISISFSQDITVFGGLNESNFNFNDDDMEWGDGMEQGFISGFNLGVEKKIGPALVGLGLNQRGYQINIEQDILGI